MSSTSILSFLPILLFLLSGIQTNLNAQDTIKYVAPFDHLDNFSKRNTINTERFDKSIQLFDGAEVIISNIDFIKTILTTYQYTINSGSIKFKIESKTPDKEEYNLISESIFSESPNNPNDLYTLYTRIKEDLGFGQNYQTRISVDIDGAAEFFINQIQLIPYTKEEQTKISENKKNEETIIITAGNQVTKVRVAEYNDRVALLRKKYITDINDLSKLSYRGNVVAGLSKLVVFVNERNKLSDPTNYSLFNSKIEYVRNNADSIQKKFLNKLTKDFEKTTPSSKDNKFASNNPKLFKTAGIFADVANLLTGGQFNSVVNSIQGLVTTIFSSENIKSRIPEIVTEIKRGDRIISKVNPNYSKTKVAKLIEGGIAAQKFFFDFFDIIDNDRKEFSQLVSKFGYYSESADELNNKVKLLRDDFFASILLEVSDEYYNTEFTKIDNKTSINSLSTRANVYFDNIMIKGIQEGEKPVSTNKLSNLDRINRLSNEVDDLMLSYSTQATDLLSLFDEIENDLDKPNPFGKYNSGKFVSKNEDVFGNSYDTYEVTRNAAKKTFKEAMNNLKVVLQ